MRTGIVVLFFLPLVAVAGQPQCKDRATLRAWVNTVEKKFASKKFNKEALKKLYMSNSDQGMEATLFNALMFQDKILMGNVAIDCHNNLVKALKPKNKKRQLSIDLWKKCTYGLYEGKEKAIVEKAVSCLEAKKSSSK